MSQSCQKEPLGAARTPNEMCDLPYHGFGFWVGEGWPMNGKNQLATVSCRCHPGFEFKHQACLPGIT
eukprot:3304302-Amphidinium_carterae.1